jgi:hypothetical protein
MNVGHGRVVLACCALALVAAGPRPALGATIAATFSLPQQGTSGSTLVNGLDGFDFRPSVDLTVTALGWYDHGGDGLLHDHPVGIYLTSAQTLFAPSVTVTVSSPLDAATDFRFAPVTPFTLRAGTTYTVVGYGEGPAFDPYVKNPIGGIAFGPELSYVRLRTSRSTGLEFPTVAGEIGLLQNLYFGPNFQYTPVPEPFSSVCLVVSMGALAARRRKSSIRGLIIAGPSGA